MLLPTVYNGLRLFHKRGLALAAAVRARQHSLVGPALPGSQARVRGAPTYHSIDVKLRSANRVQDNRQPVAIGFLRSGAAEVLARLNTVSAAVMARQWPVQYLLLLAHYCRPVDAFGGLAYLNSQHSTDPISVGVFNAPGDQLDVYGWDQTKTTGPKAVAEIGNTRVNIWSWDFPPPPPPVHPPQGCCDVYPLGVCLDCNSLTCINCCEVRIVHTIFHMCLLRDSWKYSPPAYGKSCTAASKCMRESWQLIRVEAEGYRKEHTGL
eukprot:6172304-Pleurochrysis_carterae.AAC.5